MTMMNRDEHCRQMYWRLILPSPPLADLMRCLFVDKQNGQWSAGLNVSGASAQVLTAMPPAVPHPRASTAAYAN